MINPIRIGKTAGEMIERQLHQFGESSPGIQLIVLSSADGFQVSSYLAPGASAAAAKVAAMTSSITALGDAIARETGLTAARNIVIEADNGTVLLFGIRDVKPALALSIVANKQAILGHLLWAARNAEFAISKVLTH
ncbi:roadblock/LC7 domain-containing protein [Stenotrophomonas sp.]|uniref:roadblock/LC7 domain-containing protein n=1 Tax=Stenotrophomonas sp. TaxID=69392 RepID=UPI00374D92FD